MSLISAQGVSLNFGVVPVLQGIDLTIESGEIVTVIGPNGSGESTLLRALMGAKEPTEGQIARKPGLRIGYVPQRLAVEENMPLMVRLFLVAAGAPQ